MSSANSSQSRLTRRCALFGSAALALVLSACGLNNKVFRYRLTVEIEVDGELRSGSSVIEVEYIIGRSDMEGKNWFSKLRGVAPFVDLGSYGTLIAALDGDFNEQSRKKHELKLRCKNALTAIKLPLAAYLLGPQDILNATGLKELSDGQYPYFIWLPDSARWIGWQQLCVEEFATTIGGGARLIRATIEPAPHAPLVMVVDPDPYWLAEFRESQKQFSHPRKFIIGDTSFIQRDH